MRLFYIIFTAVLLNLAIGLCEGRAAQISGQFSGTIQSNAYDIFGAFGTHNGSLQGKTVSFTYYYDTAGLTYGSITGLHPYDYYIPTALGALKLDISIEGTSYSVTSDQIDPYGFLANSTTFIDPNRSHIIDSTLTFVGGETYHRVSFAVHALTAYREDGTPAPYGDSEIFFTITMATPFVAGQIQSQLFDADPAIGFNQYGGFSTPIGGFFLSDVSVSIPEPDTMVTLFGGVTILLATRWLRRLRLGALRA